MKTALNMSKIDNIKFCPVSIDLSTSPTNGTAAKQATILHNNKTPT